MIFVAKGSRGGHFGKGRGGRFSNSTQCQVYSKFSHTTLKCWYRFIHNFQSSTSYGNHTILTHGLILIIVMTCFLKMCGLDLLHLQGKFLLSLIFQVTLFIMPHPLHNLLIPSFLILVLHSMLLMMPTIFSRLLHLKVMIKLHRKWTWFSNSFHWF